MILILLLLLATLVLVYFEVILPGGVLGLLALGCVGWATILGFQEFGVWGAIITFVVAILSTFTMIVVQFKLMANTHYGKRFFLSHEITGRVSSSYFANDLKGEEGVTLTRLNPIGKVEIGDHTYEAFSQDGYIEPSKPIVVVSQDNSKLTINKL